MATQYSCLPSGTSPLCYMVSWVERQHRKNEKYKKAKRKNRLMTDKTNIKVLCEEEDGEETALDLACSSPPPWGH